jgi:hypothetical protein
MLNVVGEFIVTLAQRERNLVHTLDKAPSNEREAN